MSQLAARRPLGAMTTRPRRRYLGSLATRLALTTALLVGSVVGALCYALIVHARREQLETKEKGAAMVAELTAELASAPLVFGDEQGIQESVGHLRSYDEVAAAAVFRWRAGEPWSPALGYFNRNDERAEVLQAPKVELVDTVQRPGEEAIDASHWVVDPSGQRIGAVVLRFTLARENGNYALLKARLVQFALAVGALLTLLLALLARIQVIKPLRAVQLVVRELSTDNRKSGALAVHESSLPLAAQNEIGDLARGFMSMAAVIERREAAIARQNREMRLVLGNVGEGFLVVDAHGVIEGQHSAILERWFGAVPAGRKLWHYLSPHDVTFAEWLELVWSNIGAAFMPLELCLEQLPKTFSSDERHYEVQYHALRRTNGSLERMVVVVEDVTELRRREQSESEQRELVEVFTALMRDRTGFLSMCEDARAFVAAGDAAAVPRRQPMLEQLHTLKGNALLFRLREFASACEMVEESCRVDCRQLTAADFVLLSHAFEQSVRVVAPIVPLESADTVQLSGPDYSAVVAALEQGESQAAVLARLSRASSEPAELVFGRFAERLQVLARRLGKCAVRVSCQGNGVRFPPQRFAGLWSGVVHVLRNIADHGLETTFEREQAGKPLEASVSIRCELDAPSNTLSIVFRDDGRGVDWDKVRERAAQRGLPTATRADLVDALLGHGFSTLEATSELSGRGVGLSALRAELKALHGSLKIESEPGQGTCLTMELPARLVIV